MKLAKKGAWILLLCWLTYIAAYLCRINISSALTKMSESLGVSIEYLGAASSVYFITYAIGQLINGFIGDRVRPYRFILIAVTATGCINFIIGIVSNAAAFVIIWGFNGYVQSMFWCSLLRLLSFHLPQRQHKTVSTVMSTSSIAGYILSWSILGKAFVSFSWQMYFVVPGLCIFALIPFWLITAKRCPMEQLLESRAKTPAIGKAIRELIEDRLYFVCLLSCSIGAIQEGAVFWLPLIFSQKLGLNTSSSFILLMIIPFSKLLGVFLARYLLEHNKENARSSMLFMLSLVAGTVLLLLLPFDAPAFVTVLLIGFLILLVNGSNWIIISYLPMYFSARNMVSTLVGILDFSVYIGAAVSSPLIGVVLTRFGWSVVPVIWSILAAAALLLTIGGAGGCLTRKGRRINEPT